MRGRTAARIPVAKPERPWGGRCGLGMGQIQELTDYITGLEISQGEHKGRPFPLMPWQRRFLRGAFRDDVDTATLSLARGGGKSTFTAAIGAAAVDGPLVQQRGECVVVASAFTQARIIFEHALSFIEDADNSRKWRIQDSQNMASIEHRGTGARLRCIGSDPRRAMGLAPALVLCDEPASWPHTSSAKMYATLTTALGKLPDSRLIAIGTRPDGEHWFEELAGLDGAYSQIHAAREKDPPFRKSTWVRANPSLPYMPTLLEAYRKDAARAKQDSGALAHFLSLRLNRGTSEVDRENLLDAATWESCIEANPPERRGVPVWGLDLGSNLGMSAVSAYWPLSYRLETVAAFSEIPSLAERERKDHVQQGLYQRLFSSGELFACGSRIVNVPELLERARQHFGGIPSAIACDRFRLTELQQALDASSLRGVRVVERGMGFRDMSEDTRLFRGACLEGKVKVKKPALLLTFALSGAVVQKDLAGNRKLAKVRSTHRDDSAAASILGVAHGQRTKPAPRPARFTLGGAHDTLTTVSL